MIWNVRGGGGEQALVSNWGWVAVGGGDWQNYHKLGGPQSPQEKNLHGTHIYSFAPNMHGDHSMKAKTYHLLSLWICWVLGSQKVSCCVVRLVLLTPEIHLNVTEPAGKSNEIHNQINVYKKRKFLEKKSPLPWGWKKNLLPLGGEKKKNHPSCLQVENFLKFSEKKITLAKVTKKKKIPSSVKKIHPMTKLPTPSLEI